MEAERNLVIATLKGLIATREVEKKRLQAVIAYSRNPQERSKALRELAIVLGELKKDLELLANLEFD